MNEVPMCRSHGITMAGFSIDSLTSVLTNGIVTHDLEHTMRCKMIDQGRGENLGQNGRPPATM
jgi:hypothetical protein